MSEQQVAAPPSPYKGLAPFEESPVDALFFFGREREREIVIANLLAYRLTVLYGASGVGKSSLLRAGVAYRLRRQGEAVVVFGTWSGDPVSSLLAEVHETLALSDAPAGGLAASLGSWAAALGRELYVILDQFDEYFLYHESEDDFARQLAEVATRPGLRVNILISIRDDMLSRLDRFKALIPNLFSNYLRLDHLDRRAAREAIAGPLERYNALVPAEQRVTADPELIEEVLDQTISGRVDPGEPLDGRRVEAPYLQLVMQRLWEEEQSGGSRTLGLAALERLGGAEEIVRAHLVVALESLSEHDRDLAAELFNHLVTPSGTKIAHGIGDLAQYASVSEGEVTPVLAALVDERIVRPVTTPGQPDGSRYEIFHDVLAEPVVAWRSKREAELELERTREEARRRHRRLLVVAGAALLAAAVMVGVTVFAFTQRSAARSQARRAHAGELAATALTQVESDPQSSMQLAVEAARLSPSPEVEDTLRRVMVKSHERAVLRQGGPVESVAFSSSGDRVASGGAEGVRLYTRSGRIVRTVRTRRPVASVVFSPDGRLLAAASGGGTALLLDGETGGVLRVLHHPRGVAAVSFGGGVVITAGGDGTARIWRPDGHRVAVLRNPGPVSTAALSNDGKLAVTVSTDRDGHSKARIFEAPTGLLLHRLPEPGITTAAFSPDGRLLATGSADRTARLWDARTGRRLHVLHHAGDVVSLDFSLDGRSLATASEDGLGRVWDVRTGGVVVVLPGANQPVDSVSFSDDGRFVVTASADGNAYVYRVEDSRLVAALAGARGPITRAVFSPEARRVATASRDGTVRLWDPDAADKLRLVRRVRTSVTAAFAPDGHIVVRPLGGRSATTAASPDGRFRARVERSRVILIDRETGHTQPLRGHFGNVYALSFSPNGRWLVTGSQFAAILWRVETGARAELFSYLYGHEPKFRGTPAHLTSASFSPDGRRIVTASLDRTVRVYDCEVCGGLGSLLELAQRRLARISRQ